MEGIEHRTTKVRSPRTNGFVERMNRTLLDECFRVSGRTTWYIEPAEIQRDLDGFIEYYNLERSHQGYRLMGRTPAQALREALAIEDLPPFILPEEVPEELRPTAQPSRCPGVRGVGEILVLEQPGGPPEPAANRPSGCRLLAPDPGHVLPAPCSQPSPVSTTGPTRRPSSRSTGHPLFSA